MMSRKNPPKEKNSRQKKQSIKNVSTEIKKQNLNTKKLSHEQENGEKGSNKNKIVAIKREYIKSSGLCRVTFRLQKEAAPHAKVVTVVGDFNNWNLKATQMKKLNNGDFEVTVELPSNKEYKFKYFVDGMHWKNDWCADKYVRNPYGYDDSVIIV